MSAAMKPFHLFPYLSSLLEYLKNRKITIHANIRESGQIILRPCFSKITITVISAHVLMSTGIFKILQKIKKCLAPATLSKMAA